MRHTITGAATIAAAIVSACGPRARIPPRPATVPSAVDASDQDAQTARALAPVLYLQRDEKFQLSRVVAVVHPQRRLIAYHLLWRDDVHGAWIPFTQATDEEIVWVAYDSTRAPTEVWTFWHGTVLHAHWRDRGTITVDVQWGKHGSLPRGMKPENLPWPRDLALFWLATWVGLPDIWLGRLQRKGPWCFCRGYRRYRDFRRPFLVGAHIDAVVRAEDPRPALRLVFGNRYSEKRLWP